jgi:hypothetical protein
MALVLKVGLEGMGDGFFAVYIWHREQSHNARGAATRLKASSGNQAPGPG